MVYHAATRHAVVSADKHANKTVERKNIDRRRENALLLGTPAFDEKLGSIIDEINVQEAVVRHISVT